MATYGEDSMATVRREAAAWHFLPLELQLRSQSRAEVRA